MTLTNLIFFNSDLSCKGDLCISRLTTLTHLFPYQDLKENVVCIVFLKFDFLLSKLTYCLN